MKFFEKFASIIQLIKSRSELKELKSLNNMSKKLITFLFLLQSH